MANPEAIREILKDENPNALFADDFDEALVGVAYRCGQLALAVYDIDLCIGKLIDDGMIEEEADEYFSFNVSGAWMGENTPIFMKKFEHYFE